MQETARHARTASFVINLRSWQTGRKRRGHRHVEKMKQDTLSPAPRLRQLVESCPWMTHFEVSASHKKHPKAAEPAYLQG